MKSTAVFGITDSTIKFLRVSPGPSKQVTAVGTLDVRGQSEDQISRNLSAWVKAENFQVDGSRVILVLPRSKVLIRQMSFPSQDRHEIALMIDQEIAGHVPYAKEDVAADFHIFSTPLGGYSQTAVVIVPKMTRDFYWKIFGEACIPVHQTTVTSIGLWALYRQFPDGGKGATAIMDLDCDSTEICVCDQNIWGPSRQVAIGLDHLQEGYGPLLQQWEMTRRMAGPQRVLIVSGANRTPGLETRMAKAGRGLSVRKILLTKMLPLSGGVRWPESVAVDGVSMAALAGIAFSREAVPVNVPGQTIWMSCAETFKKWRRLRTHGSRLNVHQHIGDP